MVALLPVLPVVGAGPDPLQALRDRVRGLGLRTQGGLGWEPGDGGLAGAEPFAAAGSCKGPKA